MSGYILTDDAELDLEEIFDFVCADSPRAALQLKAEIDDALLRLAERPRIGHVRSELSPSDIRFWVVRSYVIIYHAEVTPIVVLRVISGYRDLADQLAWGVSEAVEQAMALA